MDKEYAGITGVKDFLKETVKLAYADSVPHELVTVTQSKFDTLCGGM